MIYLSHPLSVNTPAYAGGKCIEIEKMKSLCDGDSCNQLHISMSNHIGTHVDAPAHFVENGKTITDYSPKDWVFNKCCLIDMPCEPGQVIDAASIQDQGVDFDCDMLIIRTGFEAHRGDDLYWQKSPVFHKGLGRFFDDNFSNLSSIAFDCISLSSLTDRNMGREAHREILGKGIRIFEDVKLSRLAATPKQVFVYPLLIENADGTQVTMVAKI